ncbi:uncharacterized protein LOC106865930 [Brachypodium distachyon]|uniref:uncharacterized protein LOC106865930 n=1 Tax=Brachypodium distachyon TaxID=15368 RepID=UPI00071CD9FC|nr:uncharacterized protein LOC106865930 [Brachypodium distachyon]|eukprot:XP_014753408.1 uncharacterized protein LOC106865930 [Brachypodium distachyon]
MATAIYLDDTDAEAINPPKNEMLDVTKLVGYPTQHSPKQNITVSSNMHELLECHASLIAMNPPNHQCSNGEVPYFDGTNYASWKHRMKFHLYSMNPLVWRIVETGFVVVDEANPTVTEYRLLHNNAQATNALFCALSEDEFSLVCTLENAKEIWNTLQEIHEGSSSVREAKVDLLRCKLDWFELSEGESLHDMYTRLNSLVNEIKDLGGKDMTNLCVVKKLLRVMETRNPSLVNIIRQSDDFNELTPNFVFGRFLIHDIRKEESRIVRDLNKCSNRRRGAYNKVPPTHIAPHIIKEVAPQEYLTLMAQTMHHGSTG